MKAHRFQSWKKLLYPFFIGFFLLIFLNPCLGSALLPRLDASTPIHGPTLRHKRVVAYDKDALTVMIKAQAQKLKKYFLIYSLTPPPKPPIFLGGNFVGVDIKNFRVLKRGVIPSSGIETLTFPVNRPPIPWNSLHYIWFQVFILDQSSPWGIYSTNGMELRVLPEKGRYILTHVSSSRNWQYDLKNRCVIAMLGGGQPDEQSNDLNIILCSYFGHGSSYYINNSEGNFYSLPDSDYADHCLSPDGDFILYCQALPKHIGFYNTHTKQVEHVIPMLAAGSICSSAYGRYIWLADTSGPSRVAIYETHTGTLTYLTNYSWNREFEVVCTPDGRYGAIWHGKEIHVLDRETLIRTKIADTNTVPIIASETRTLDISPSGKLVAYLDWDSNGPAAFLHDRTTGNTTKISTGSRASNYLSTKISNDEKILIFLDNGGFMGNSALWAYDIPNRILFPFWASGPLYNLWFNSWIN